MPPLQSVGVPAVSLKQVRLREEPTTHLIEGRKTRKYVLNLSYEVKMNVGSEKVRGVFNATAELWTTDEIEASVLPLDPRRIRTGFGVIDASVREALSVVKGFPLERRLSVTRRLAGGAPFTDLVTTSFREFESLATPPQNLDVPPGYRYQEPILGMGASR